MIYFLNYLIQFLRESKHLFIKILCKLKELVVIGKISRSTQSWFDPIFFLKSVLTKQRGCNANIRMWLYMQVLILSGSILNKERCNASRMISSYTFNSSSKKQWKISKVYKNLSK